MVRPLQECTYRPHQMSTHKSQFVPKHRRNYLRIWFYFFQTFFQNQNAAKSPGTITMSPSFFVDNSMTFGCLVIEYSVGPTLLERRSLRPKLQTRKSHFEPKHRRNYLRNWVYFFQPFFRTKTQPSHQVLSRCLQTFLWTIL